MFDPLKFVRPNGKLPLELGWSAGLHRLEVIGGPFDAYRPGYNADYGVCVRAERVPDTADFVLPIYDFNVPANTAAVEEAIKATLRAMLGGKRVWVGCMGGWGRTGLFLALLAKACGEKDPVGYVRRHYSPRAVETKAQAAYVEAFDVTPIRDWLFWRGWGVRWASTFLWWL